MCRAEGIVPSSSPFFSSPLLSSPLFFFVVGALLPSPLFCHASGLRNHILALGGVMCLPVVRRRRDWCQAPTSHATDTQLSDVAQRCPLVARLRLLGLSCRPNELKWQVYRAIGSSRLVGQRLRFFFVKKM